MATKDWIKQSPGGDDIFARYNTKTDTILTISFYKKGHPTGIKNEKWNNDYFVSVGVDRIRFLKHTKSKERALKYARAYMKKH